MVAKQLSIFLENKSGRLTEVTEVLAKEGVNLSALCIAENADFGILRGIVSEPDKAYKALKDNHFAVNVTDGKYKWVHYNCERLSEKDIDWMKQLPEKAYFEADGWSYGIAHQYDNGYGTVESRYAFDQYWNASYGAECDGKRRLIFGHTHRQCIHTLGEGMEWINPGSISYRRPDDPDKTAHYAVILDGKIQLKSIAYDRTLQLAEAKRLLKNDRMMRTELQDFMFFFGDAKTSRDPL